MINEEETETAVTHELGDKVPRGGNFITRGIAGGLMKLDGWKVVLNNVPNLPKMLLVGGPHSSSADFFLALGAIYQEGVRVSWMAKHSMFRWPVNGLLRSMGGVPVDRTKSTNMVQQVIDAFNERDEFIISIMPEGTRGYREKWRSGFYHIARGANVPIVPVAMDYGKRVVTVGPKFDLTGDVELDLPMIQAFFADVVPRRPDRKIPGNPI